MIKLSVKNILTGEHKAYPLNLQGVRDLSERYPAAMDIALRAIGRVDMGRNLAAYLSNHHLDAKVVMPNTPLDPDTSVNLQPQTGRPIEVATIAIMDGHKILMGRRKDDKKWTFPGGHLEPGEDPFRGVMRELWEEAGIKGVVPAYLGSEDVTSPDGQIRRIHCFMARGQYRTNTAGDPDHELRTWEWVDVKGGLPKIVEEQLHAPKNVLLKKLGLQVWH